jgi:hypothetical protein
MIEYFAQLLNGSLSLHILETVLSLDHRIDFWQKDAESGPQVKAKESLGIFQIIVRRFQRLPGRPA